MSRPSRRNTYNTYLHSPTWKRLRRQALTRDKFKCRGCGDPAQHVHHDRYPNVYGQEKLSWLYSVCADCHTAIHEMVNAGAKLKTATRQVVVVMNDPMVRPRKQKKAKKQVTRDDVVRLKRRLENPSPKVSPSTKMKRTLKEENDRLHQIAVNRRVREAARKGLA